MILLRTEDDVLVNLDKVLFINIEFDGATFWVVANFKNLQINIKGFQYRWQAERFLDEI
jgi:hypothetical protein